jgi:chromosome transmission fidelity protein 4
MQLEDKITHAYFQDSPVTLASTPTTLFTAANKSIKVFNLKNTTSEPEIISTLDLVKSIDLRQINEQYHGLIAGGFDCAWHDLSDFIIKPKDSSNNNNNNNNNNDQDLSRSTMKNIWKSSARISQAVFTHGGQRACIGDLAANMIIVDVSNPNDENSFGKVLEKTKVSGEITGLAYSYSVDLLAVTVADGGLSIYSLISNLPEKKATIGNILVDKRIALTHEMGLVDDDSDFSDLSENDDDDLDDADSMFTETTSGVGGKNQRNKANNLLKFASSKTVWNPVGDVLAIPNKNFKIDFYSVIDWSKPIFSLHAGIHHHKNHITDIAFSPNGKLLASISLDKTLIVWDFSLRKIVAKTLLPFLGCNIIWSDDSSIIIGSNKGKVITIDGDSFKELMTQNPIKERPNKTNDLINNQAAEDSDDMGDDVMQTSDEENDQDSQLDKQNSQDLGDFVIDDDNDDHRYPQDSFDNRRRNHDAMSESTELTDFKKRSRNKANGNDNHTYRLAVKSGWGKSLTRPFSVGATPWDGSDRRYLSITPIGCVYTVKVQNSFRITVLFFDEENHKKYFFDDLVGYDICSINDQGAVFATSGFDMKKNYIARIEYKDHNNGRSGETQWIREISLRPYEFITSLSVYGNSVFVCTNKGFVRKYNLFGRLMNIVMMDCVIGIMNNNNYVFTIIKRSIESGYLFNIQNLDGDYIQQEVGIPLITENDITNNFNNEVPIKSMFFSSDGEPCIVRNDNLLLVLTKWRDPNSKPIWKPLLDIQEGVSRAGRGRELKAWPLGLFGDSFTFVPFRGSKNYPIFPLLTPMNVDIRIPLNYEDPEKIRNNNREMDEDEIELFGDDRDNDNNNNNNNNENNNKEDPEEKFLRTLVLAEMLNDSISNNDVNDSDNIEKLQLLSLEYDKSLLIQIDDACTSGDSDDAFELCKMIRDFRALNAAQKLAEVKGMAGLARRIRNLHEARMNEEEEDAVDEALNGDSEF